MTTTTKKDAPEPAKGFSYLLKQMDEGALIAELTETMHTVSNEIAEQSERLGADIKGSLTLTLSLVARRNGTVSVNGDIKSKVPTITTRVGSLFWLDRDGQLTLDNPRQQKLPMREVAPLDRPREVSPDEVQPTRTL